MDDLRPAFAEPSQTGAYATIHVLIETGRITPARWAEAFGAAPRRAERAPPNDGDTYYDALAHALGQIFGGRGSVTGG